MKFVWTGDFDGNVFYLYEEKPSKALRGYAAEVPARRMLGSIGKGQGDTAWSLHDVAGKYIDTAESELMAKLKLESMHQG